MNEKLVKIGFAVLALFALIFGFISLGQNLKLTFGESEGEKTDSSDAILEETKLKMMDTDEDGLNDWDEMNVYGTSPYLADSDSDGVNDLDEIKKGTDPNCPAGKTCGTSLQKPSETTQPAAASSAPAETLPTEELQQLTPAEIRELLKQGGITDEQLQGASDEELKQLLDEALNQQQDL